MFSEVERGDDQPVQGTAEIYEKDAGRREGRRGSADNLLFLPGRLNFIETVL